MSTPIPVQVLAAGPLGFNSPNAQFDVTALENPDIGPAPAVEAELFQPSNPLQTFEPTSLQPPKLLYLRFDFNQFAYKPTGEGFQPLDQLESLAFKLLNFLQVTQVEPNLNWHFVNGPSAFNMMVSKFGLQFAQLGNQANGFVIPDVSLVRTWDDLVPVAQRKFRPGQPFILRANTSNALIPTPGILFTDPVQLRELLENFDLRNRFFPTFDDNYLLFSSPLDDLSGVNQCDLENCVPLTRRFIYQALFIGYPNDLPGKPPDLDFDGGLLYVQRFDTGVKPYFINGCCLVQNAGLGYTTECLARACSSACPQQFLQNVCQPEANAASTNGPFLANEQLFNLTPFNTDCTMCLTTNPTPNNAAAASAAAALLSGTSPALGNSAVAKAGGQSLKRQLLGVARAAWKQIKGGGGSKRYGKARSSVLTGGASGLDAQGKMPLLDLQKRNLLRGAMGSGTLGSGGYTYGQGYLGCDIYGSFFTACGGGDPEDVQLLEDYKSGFWAVFTPSQLTSSILSGASVAAFNTWANNINQFRLANRLDICFVEFAVQDICGVPTIETTDIRLNGAANPFAEAAAGLSYRFALTQGINYVRDRQIAINL
jgi:hypothetical protein